MTLSRRDLLHLCGGGVAGALAAPLPRAEGAPPPEDVPAPMAALRPMTDGVAAITVDEHRARILRAQGLMREGGLDAIVLASGTGLGYFTGAEWGLSERFFGAVITREGDPAWVTPAFEKARALEQIQIGGDVRAWEEHESPWALVASILRERQATGRIGIEETTPFTFADEIGAALPAAKVVSATAVTAGCRMIKDAHELALMRRAGEITVRAFRAVFQSLREGMTQPLRRGEVVLIDGGGRLHGYASDITRTGVFGAAPTERQRRVWDVVRRAQQAAFEAARPGAEAQSVDAAARRVVDEAGLGPDYRLFTHRVGHGIGMDGHEWTYLVRGNRTLLRPGMCFSDEPGIYVPGEMGVRLEDIIFITETGAENMTKWSGSPEDPAVV